MPESSRKSDQRQSLVKYAGRILAARPYFRFKLREKLFLRAEKEKIENPGQIIESILDDLAQSGYLNDQYLAEAYVRRQLSKHYGPRLISVKLKYLGLGVAAVTEALRSAVSPEAEEASIRHFISKFSHQDRRKVVSNLYRRGYSERAIKSAFDGDCLED